jgi:hypothetical protein
MNEKLVLFYSNNRRDPSEVARFYRAHRSQAERLGIDFRAVVFSGIGDGDIAAPHCRECFPYFSGIFRNILLALNAVPDSTAVYLAEDDCLSPDSRFDMPLASPLHLHYPMHNLYICERGFFSKGGGWNLGFSYGTAKAMRHNFSLKMLECMGLMNRPATSVEPVHFDDEANRCYLTVNVEHHDPNLDFRGIQGDGRNSTWGWNGEPISATNATWGNAAYLWRRMISGEEARA